MTAGRFEHGTYFAIARSTCQSLNTRVSIPITGADERRPAHLNGIISPRLLPSYCISNRAKTWRCGGDFGWSRQARSQGKLLDQSSRNGAGYRRHATSRSCAGSDIRPLCAVDKMNESACMIRYRDKANPFLKPQHPFRSKPTSRYSCRH